MASKLSTRQAIYEGFGLGVEQCAEAAGVEVVWIYPPLLAFAYRKPLSKQLMFCCHEGDREKVMKAWEEWNAGSGSPV